MYKKGVTQPSQLRYISYFSQFLIGKDVSYQAIRLKQVRFESCEHNKSIYLEVYDSPYEGRCFYSFCMKREDLASGSYSLNYSLLLPGSPFIIQLDVIGDLYFVFKHKLQTGL